MSDVIEKKEIGTAEAARRLGVGRSTIYRLLERRLLPYTQVGLLKKIPAAAVERYLESHRFGALEP
jgi:excisionase family DNA binding protein